MAAILNIAMRNGAAPGTETSFLASSGFRYAFKSVDNATQGNYASYPITVSDAVNGGNSYEVWSRFKFTGTFNIVENVQFWAAALPSPPDGATLKWKGNNQTTYATPTTDDSTVATTAIPTADPGTANVSIGGSLSGQITVSGDYTDYIVMQLHLGTTAELGPNTFTFTVQYDEM